MSIKNTTLTTTVSNIATGGGNLGTATTTIYFCNYSSTATTFNLYLVPNDGSSVAGNATVVYSNKLVAGNDTYIADLEKIFLSPGDTIQANANIADAITVSVSTIGI